MSSGGRPGDVALLEKARKEVFEEYMRKKSSDDPRMVDAAYGDTLYLLSRSGRIVRRVDRMIWEARRTHANFNNDR